MSATPDRWIDRSGWPGGPWDAEPDRIEWRHGALPCLIVRGPMGALCGYVGVPPGHPWHRLDYSAVDAHVHGGITYGAPCQAGGHICHVAQPGEPEPWWIGFDCNHSGDYAPKDAAFWMHHERLTSCGGYYKRGESYRDADYVRGQVESLARQAEDASHA